MLHKFPRPVSMLVGLGFPRQIDSVDKAVAFLDDYPLLLRDESYQATRDVCLDALSECATTEEAHDVFCAFARRRGILIEGTLPDLSMESHGTLAA
jgi:hypothetical protein